MGCCQSINDSAKQPRTIRKPIQDNFSKQEQSGSLGSGK